MSLFGQSDPETIRNGLFKLCDTDHNDFLSQAEIIDVWTTLLKVMNSEGTESEMKDMNDELEKTKNEVRWAFGDKTQISLEEFCQFSDENEAMQCLFSIFTSSR